MNAEESQILPEVGDEFIQVRGVDDNFYVITIPGSGTHVWDGEKIVEKEAKHND